MRPMSHPVQYPSPKHNALPVHPNQIRFFSPSLRFACAGALGLILLQAATPLHVWLEYRLEDLATQPWRALTGHLIHLNATHMTANALGWLLIASLFAHALSPRRQIIVWAISSVCISIALALIWPTISVYRGFSGTLHALYFSGALAGCLAACRTSHTKKYEAALPWFFYSIGLAKVFLEQPWHATMPYAAWLGIYVAPQVHLIGALIGSALGAWFALKSSQTDPLRSAHHERQRRQHP